jgi:2-phosphosulfolactate phosphatase
MKITTCYYSKNLAYDLVRGKIAVVIDLFRATSVMVTAFEYGIHEIIVTGSKDEAFSFAKNYNNTQYILGGEEKMQKISGFDYGNSPQEYIGEKIANKNLIMTTTNGTKAIKFCEQAAEIYICSMLNCEAVANKLAAQKNDLTIVCAGSHGNFSLEDGLCAGMLLSYLERYGSLEIDDLGLTVKTIYENSRNNLNKTLVNSSVYKALVKKGFADDIKFCLQKNIYSVVPKCVANKINI